jgi:ribosomal protein S18 acetylase RimI-like enzyme
MELREITITHADTGWHEAFLEFVPKVFPRIGFRGWYEHGGWDERYSVFALAEGERLVASGSLLRMDLVLHGRSVRGFQLGSVGTLPEHRGRGLQRRVLPRLLAQTGADDLVFLFANHQVLDFYPRFGFEPVRERLFRAECHVAPQGAELRTLDVARPSDRALLRRIAGQAQPVTTLFGARDYGTTLLWYWSNFHPRALRHAPEHDAILAVEQSGPLLRVYDVLTSAPLDLVALLPRVIAAPIAELEFGFTPEHYWPDAKVRADYTDSPLFVRGPHRLPSEPFKFPMLAQT